MANENEVNNQQASAEDFKQGENGQNTITQDETNWEQLAKEAIAAKAVAESDRDNYKKGLLMAKGKLQDDGTADKLVNDATDISKIVADEVKKAVEPFAKQNEELKVALQNRSQIQSHQGSNQENKSEVKTQFWSSEQLEYFKKRGLDPNKIYETWKKQQENK